MYNCRAEEDFNVLIYKMCNNASCASPTPKGGIYGHKYRLSIKYYILLRFSRASPTPKGVIYEHFPHRVAHPKNFYKHLWLIDGHF